MTGGGIKALIFDLGNVLVDFDHMIAAKRAAAFTDKTPRQIYDMFFDSRLTAVFEEGKITPEDFFFEIKKALDLRLDYAGFCPIWNEIFFLSERNRQVHSLAKVLKARYKIALLSNINIMHFEYLKKNFPIFDAFHNIITSFESGHRKPDLEIYEQALGLLGAAPEEAFYTDDRPELVGRAREYGISGFVFTGVERLKNDLLEKGVEIK
ncbi:MAG: HAD hydrolase-like protein [Candidatus Omnitrophica bacterium]|nr:HAD hydrolase-like protein [Candidatus Omnitrophota bacterium]MDD5552423.1 HAD hydrolase-like protein [Candidatus Omnitrophota bacterium]